MDTSRARYSYDSEVMGYHVYQDIWEATNGEILECCKEMENAFDPFVVCVKKDAVIVGHVPRKISPICSLFLGNSHCEITEGRRCSRGIPQGGLEIPCRLIFEGSKKYVDMSLKKLEKLKNTKEKPTSDVREETKKPVKTEAISQVVDSHKKASDLNFVILKRSKRITVGKKQEKMVNGHRFSALP